MGNQQVQHFPEQSCVLQAPKKAGKRTTWGNSKWHRQSGEFLPVCPSEKGRELQNMLAGNKTFSHSRQEVHIPLMLRTPELDMISGVRRRLSLLTRGNWNQKESKISFRGGEQESYKEHWQGLDSRRKSRICWSCFWTEVISQGRFVQLSTNFQSLESLPPFHHNFCAAACETFWHSI